MFGYSTPQEFLIVAVAVILSLSVHEWAHAYVAYLNGDMTAKVNGRMTLNPLKHFDPVGLVMMLAVRFGYAKPVPVDPNNFRRRKTGIITVAIAGVVMNLLLAFISALLFILCFNVNNLIMAYVGLFFYYMCMLNVHLALFNLLPLFPLDGFRVVEGATRQMNPVTRFLRTYGQYILILLVGINFLVNYLPFPAFFRYFDVLGTYLGFLGQKIYLAFINFWLLIF